MSISCPKCGVEVSNPPEREWRFQQYQVSRFRCEHGDKFNFYSGPHKTFTIPRAWTEKNQCKSCGAINPEDAVYCKDCGTKILISESASARDVTYAGRRVHPVFSSA